MLNALTVDLEDWYQGLTSTGRRVDDWPGFEDRVGASTQRLLEMLDQAQVKATFFVLGYVADRFPELVRQVADAGHEIGLHGYYHRQVSTLTPCEFRADTLRGRRAVEEASRKHAVGYRAPMFSIGRSTCWALEALAEMDFEYDSSVFPTWNMLYGFPGAPRFPYRPIGGSPFVEFPLSTVRLLGVNWPVAGGFYLRALPYSVFRGGVRALNRKGRPAILYLHPWDLDVDQPVPSPTIRERFTHYYNLRRTQPRLRSLLEDFHFGPLCELLKQPLPS